jgi:hypothetical protein
VRIEDLPKKEGCEVVPTAEVRVGDRIEAIGYGLGMREVEAIESEGEIVIVFTLGGEPWETTRGLTNDLRLRSSGQAVWREVA